MSKIRRPLTDNVSNIVLVHGWSMHSGMWGRFADTLTESHRVSCLDLPGHGGNRLVNGFDLNSVSECLLDAAPKTACWIGWSLGASLVMNLARCCPERVEKVILLAGNAKFVAGADWPTGMDLSLLRRFTANLVEDNHGALLRFLSLQTQGLCSPKSILKDLRERLESRNPPLDSALIGGLNILENADSREALKNIHCPALLLLGELDTLVPVAAGEAMKAICPSLRLHVVKGAGHMPFYTHVEETVSVVQQFLSEPGA